MNPEKWIPVFGKDHAQKQAKAKWRLNLMPFRFSGRHSRRRRCVVKMHGGS
jgi:hypothetical protein